MGWKRALAIYTVIQQQKQAQQQEQAKKEAAQGTDQKSGNVAGTVNQQAYSAGGETTSFNAGLLSYKKGKKEAQKLGQSNYAMVDEHQGQILLG